MVSKPWELSYSPWKSEAEFITWVRGGLRKLWSTHPVKLEYLTARKEKIDNPNEKTKARFPKVNGYKCEVCNKYHLKVQVDHISETGGTFRKIEDIQEYAKYLYYISFEDIRLICKSCHGVVTHAQKKGISFEDAQIEKEAIRIKDEESLEDILDFIESYNYNGTYQVNNATNRRKAVEDILRNVT